jgi:hypothetical protein
VGSPEFPGWWNDHRVLRRTHGAKHYRHLLVGDLHFSYESLQPTGDEDQTLCVYNVEPGSSTQRSLQLLSSWATARPEVARTAGTPEARSPPAD